MNLHIFNDEKFFDPFVGKLEQLGLLDVNKFIVKKGPTFKYIKRTDVVSSTLDSKNFKEDIGDVNDYSKVFLHSFTYDLYKWVLHSNFQELNWVVWGTDLYELRQINYCLYEKETESIRRKMTRLRTLAKYYQQVQYFLQSIDVEKIYSKIDNILTWISPEYEFAINNIKGLTAKRKYFVYGFDFDVETLSEKFEINDKAGKILNGGFKCVIGNSGAITNNHLDALRKIQQYKFEEILLPVSYGNKHYINLLKNKIQGKYPYSNINYIDTFISFEEYVKVLYQYDIFISNSIRPLGMGNIWIALLTGKLVFMNSKNFIYDYMRQLGLQIYNIENINLAAEYAVSIDREKNRALVIDYLSKDKIDNIYKSLFGAHDQYSED